MKNIVRLVIRNFQSHEYTEMEFSPGINAIVGESNHGKTAIIRALKWLLFNEPRGEEFVRWDTEECSVTAVFSDGYEVTRLKRKNRNSYLVKNPRGVAKPYENFSTTIPEEVLDATGVRKIMIDQDVDLAIHLNEQLDSAFLISDTGSLKAKTIGSIVQTNIIDAAERDIQRDMSQAKSRLGDLETQIADVDRQIALFGDMDQQEQVLAQMDACVGQLGKLHAAAQRLGYLRDKLVAIDEDLRSNQRLLAQISCLPRMQMLYAELKDQFRSYQQLSQMGSKLAARSEEIAKTAATISQLQHVPAMQDALAKLQGLHPQAKVLSQKKTALTNIDQEMARTKITLDQLSTLPEMIDAVDRLQEQHAMGKALAPKLDSMTAINKAIGQQQAVITQLAPLSAMRVKVQRIGELLLVSQRLSSSATKLGDVQGSMAKGRAFMATNRTNRNRAVVQYMSMLRSKGQCPTCMHAISEAEMKKIERELKGVG